MPEPDQSQQLSDFSPYPKSFMTTKVGRFVELWSYGDLLFAAVTVLALSTAYYSFLPWTEHTLDKPAGVADALYFSLVTFTSLGYGDFTPKGFGRIVAIADVVVGLALTALLIGKFASERQSAILVLLHTSDCQRRIAGFVDSLCLFKQAVERTTEPPTDEEIETSLRNLQHLMEAISNYIIFNAVQARIAEFGNTSGLTSLYRQLDVTFNSCEQLVRGSTDRRNVLIMRRAFSACTRIKSLLSHMRKIHHQASLKSTSINSLVVRSICFYRRPESELDGAARLAEILEVRMTAKLERLLIWRTSSLNPDLIDRVYEHFPFGPKETWGKHIHKSVASDLGITNSMASKAISALIAEGRLPRREKRVLRRRNSDY